MARTVFGTIKKQGNAPLVGARVIAWDSDPTNPDDEMGSSVTGTDGGYSLTYADGKWDAFPSWTTRWRPDIFVTVDVKNEVGLWTRVGRSSVHENHRLSDDLRIDLVVTVPDLHPRTVFGTISWASDGSPVNEAMVDILDQDFGTASDLMGTDVTGPDGRYSVVYGGGEWDPAPQFTGLWRPDIFIKVRLKNNLGQWKVVHRSDVAANHRIGQGLQIDARVSPPPRAKPPVERVDEEEGPLPGTAGTRAVIWNQVSDPNDPFGIRHIYVNDEYVARIESGHQTEVHVPCGFISLIQAKDEISEAANAVTFQAAVIGRCFAEEAIQPLVIYY